MLQYIHILWLDLTNRAHKQVKTPQAYPLFQPIDYIFNGQTTSLGFGWDSQNKEAWYSKCHTGVLIIMPPFPTTL